jgi:hypothetical protein
MTSKEILSRIEEIITRQVNSFHSDERQENNSIDQERGVFREIIFLAIQFVVNIVKAPFKIGAKYLRDELIIAIKNDGKLYSVIMGIMGVLFVFFSVLWLFVAVAVGVYFFQSGSSMLSAILYSIVFQIISFVLVSLVVLLLSKKLKSFKMLAQLNSYK